MSAEENKAIVRRIFDQVWNQGNVGILNELFTLDMVAHDQLITSGDTGLDGYRQYVMSTRSAFPDVHFTIEDQIAEGDRVVTRYTVTGTHRGTLMGVAPTGKTVKASGMVIGRHGPDGRTAEFWNNYDALGMMQQLGIVPAPAETTR